MFLLIVAFIFVVLLVLFKLSYNQYASGLKEQPSYFFWFITQIIRLKGWSTEEYSLRTSDFHSNGQSGYLSAKDVPRREQSRPKMLRAVPHRQLSQQAPDDIMYAMHKYIESITIPKYGGETINKDLLLRGISIIEYTGANAIFLPNVNQKIFGNGEIAHLHSNDGSFHMIVHPADAKLLIEQQWAERFPLVGMNLFNKIIVPETYTLVYAPQNENEIQIWKKILHASIAYYRVYQKNIK